MFYLIPLKRKKKTKNKLMIHTLEYLEVRASMSATVFEIDLKIRRTEGWIEERTDIEIRHKTYNKVFITDVFSR